MSEKRHRLLAIKDTIEGLETTILLEITKFPDNERIVYPRESEHLGFHQIGGTYDTIEDFNKEWETAEEPIENTVLCPKCREPITYLTPNLAELVNFTCMEYDDARRLSYALIELLEDRGG